MVFMRNNALFHVPIGSYIEIIHFCKMHCCIFPGLEHVPDIFLCSFDLFCYVRCVRREDDLNHS